MEEQLEKTIEFTEPGRYISSIKSLNPSNSDTFVWNSLARETALKKTKPWYLRSHVFNLFIIIIPTLLPFILQRNLYKWEFLSYCFLFITVSVLKSGNSYEIQNSNSSSIEFYNDFPTNKSRQIYDILIGLIQDQGFSITGEPLRNADKYETELQFENLGLSVKFSLFFEEVEDGDKSNDYFIEVTGNYEIGNQFNEYITQILETAWEGQSIQSEAEVTHYVDISRDDLTHAINNKIPITSYVKASSLTKRKVDVESSPLFYLTDDLTGGREVFVYIVMIIEATIFSIMLYLSKDTDSFIPYLYLTITFLVLIFLSLFRTFDSQLLAITEKKFYIVISKDKWKYRKTNKELELLLKLNLNDLGIGDALQNKISTYKLNSIPFKIPWSDLQQSYDSIGIPILVSRRNYDKILNDLKIRLSKVIDFREMYWNNLFKQVHSIDLDQLNNKRRDMKEISRSKIRRSNAIYAPIIFFIFMIAPMLFLPLVNQGTGFEYSPSDRYLIFDQTYNSEISIVMENVEQGRYYIVASYESYSGNYQEFRGKVLVDDRIVHQDQAGRNEEIFFQFDLVLEKSSDLRLEFEGRWKYTIKIYHGQTFPMIEYFFSSQIILFSIICISAGLPFYIENGRKSIPDRFVDRLLGIDTNKIDPSNYFTIFIQYLIIIAFFLIFTFLQLSIMSSNPTIEFYYQYMVTSRKANLYFNLIWGLFIVGLSLLISKMERSNKSSIGLSILILVLSIVMVLILFPNMTQYLEAYWAYITN